MSLLGLLLADARHGQAFWWEPCLSFVFVLVLSLSLSCLSFVFVFVMSLSCLCHVFVFVFVFVLYLSLSCLANARHGHAESFYLKRFSLPSFACSLITLYITWWFLFDPNDKLIWPLRSVFKPPNFWSRFRATQFLCIFKKGNLKGLSVANSNSAANLS